jgi:hypothetical protein
MQLAMEQLPLVLGDQLAINAVLDQQKWEYVRKA